MEQEKISIIVPVYKVERYLQRCVESILGQTYRNLEVILVDDGSPDSCPTLCDQMSQKDSRIIVIHKDNGGVSSARNAALAVITGIYVGFVDSDDWIEPDMYEILLRSMKENQADIAQCGFCIEREGKSEFWEGIREQCVISGDEGIQSMVSGGYPGVSNAMWNKLYKASLFHNIAFSEDYQYGEDLLINYQLMKKGCRISVFNICKYHYFRHAEAVCNRIESAWVDNTVSFYSDLMQWEKNTELYSCCEKALIVHCFALLNGIIRKGSEVEQYSILRQTILSYEDKILHGQLYGRDVRWKLRLLKRCPAAYSIMVYIQKWLWKGKGKALPFDE